VGRGAEARARRALLAWYTDNERQDLPWRGNRDLYAILVREVMLQQTQVERVAVFWANWIERWPTVESLAEARVAEVVLAWQGLGYNRRAVNLHRACKEIVERGWPEDLTTLPGVGRYTADAIELFARERSVLPIDVNVRRIQARTGLSFDHECAEALMRLGKLVCIARVPRCGRCPIAADCPSRGRRFETSRKQPPFQGSFRERRARTLRSVAARPVPVSTLDEAAVDALARDGLLEVRGGLARLPD
jgi:A/G-specific adenine glycosylase